MFTTFDTEPIELEDFSFTEIQIEVEGERYDLEIPDKFNKRISIKVTPETYLLWKEWRNRIHKVTGFDNETKAFEFALVEAYNTPIEAGK